MENKHNKTLQTVEERHAVELKKLQEKMLAAEKVRREKWLDEKTKKIKVSIFLTFRIWVVPPAICFSEVYLSSHLN